MDPSLGRIFASLASKASAPTGENEAVVAVGRETVARLRGVFLGKRQPDDYDDLLSRVEVGENNAVQRLGEVLDRANPNWFYPTLGPLAAEAGHAGFVPPPPANLETQDSVIELEEAIAQQRELLAAEPENSRHAFFLGMLLDDIAIHYRDLGRNEDALVAAQQSAEFGQALAEDDPDYGRRVSFDLLSDAYAKLGRFEEAAKIKEEGLEHDRDSWSLKELSSYYTSLGRMDEAVEKAEEAVAIEREKGNANSHQSGLSFLLEHLSATYRAVGRKEDALLAAEQAVSIHRSIAAEGPVTGCELGRTLTMVITLQDELEHLDISPTDRDEAVAATENCLALHRVMASTDIEGLATLLAQRGTLALLANDTSSRTLSEVHEELESLAATVSEEHPAIIWLRTTEPTA